MGEPPTHTRRFVDAVLANNEALQGLLRPPELPEADGRRARRRRAHEERRAARLAGAETTSGADAVAHQPVVAKRAGVSRGGVPRRCALCGVTFESGNQLFQHLPCQMAPNGAVTVHGAHANA